MKSLTKFTVNINNIYHVKKYFIMYPIMIIWFHDHYSLFLEMVKIYSKLESLVFLRPREYIPTLADFAFFKKSI